MLMPKLIADEHDHYLEAFLETSESKVMAVERAVVVQTKRGFIRLATLMIKVLPNLSEGIRIVGFLKPYKSQLVEEEEGVVPFQMIYNAQSFQIICVSENCT